MRRDSGLIAYLAEVFELLGPIRTRRMFGGYGVYHQGLMFGLVMDDTLYLKTDAESRPLFDAAGLAPFVYHKRGKPLPLSYCRAPDGIFDDRELALLWGQRAYGAALRAARR
jgi:DNA transformation protein